MDQEEVPQEVHIDVESHPVSLHYSFNQPDSIVNKSREQQVPEQDPNSPDNKETAADKEAGVVVHEVVSDRVFSLKQQRIAKVFVFLFLVGVLIFGRASVPSNEIACVEDKTFNVLENITRWLIATPGNEGWRNALQIIGSALIDIVFLITLGYWVIYGRSSRLIITLAIFYGVRAVVQHLFWLPFPNMYWWEDPGMPSLVVPYGRGSDFFFSGHSGFVVICMMEWATWGYKKIKWFCAVVLAYTIFILLVYRIHYCIDIFTGVFFADYTYLRVTKGQDWLDAKFVTIAAKIRGVFNRKKKVEV